MRLQPAFVDFRAFIQEHRGFVRRTLLNLGVPSSELADVEQDVFFGAERGLKDFNPARATDPKTALHAWLFGICERQAANHYRVLSRRSCEVHLDEEMLNEIPSGDPGAEDSLSQAEYGSLLDDVLRDMDPIRRAVLVGHDLERIPARELAEALKLPVNTMWNTLRLARADAVATWRKGGKRLGAGIGLLAGATIPADPKADPVAAGLGARLADGAMSPVRWAQRCSWALGTLKASFASAGWVLAGTFAVATSYLWASGTGTLSVKEAVGSAHSERSGSLPEVAPSERSNNAPARGPENTAPRGSGDASGPAGTSSLVATGTPEALKAAPSQHPVSRGSGVGLLGSAPNARAAARPNLPQEDSDLRREIAHIRLAQSALESGDIDAARQAVSRHAAEFPRGRLATERDVISIRALLFAGRHEEARSFARRCLEERSAPGLRSALEALVGPL